MHCTEFLARYSDYDDSLLPAEEAGRFRAHLAACAPCARYDRVLRKGRMLARQLPRPDASPAFRRRLELRLQGARGGRRVAPVASWSAAAAALVLLLATGSLLLVEAERSAGVIPGPRMGAAAQAAQRTGPGVAFSAGRVVALPPAAVEDPGQWPAGRVDRRVASSYSPLVIGPPAYRAPRSLVLTSTATSRRTLD